MNLNENIPPRIPGYTYVQKIGEGGTSFVYSYKSKKNNRIVAVKVLKAEFRDDPDYTRRFIREALITKKLNHTNVVKIFNVSNENNHDKYIIMEYLEETLSHKIMRYKIIPPQKVMEIGRQIASALYYAHRNGIVHRDVKPANIMFRRNGTPVIVDFGLARSEDMMSSMSSRKIAAGTLLYMSPEHCKQESCEAASDIFSLGVVLYEALAGYVPYNAQNINELICKHLQKPFLPRELSRYQPLIDGMLALEKNKRFRNGKEVISEIEHLEPSSASLPLDSGHLPPHKIPKRKRLSPLIPVFSVLLVIILIVAIAVLGYNLFNKPREENYAINSGQDKVEKYNPGATNVYEPGKKPINNSTDNISSLSPGDKNQTHQPLSQNEEMEQTLTLDQSETPHTNSVGIDATTPGESAGTISGNNTQTINKPPDITPQPEINYTDTVISLNRLDPDVRQVIESKLVRIPIEISDIEADIKTGYYKLIIQLSQTGSVLSADIPQMSITPTGKAAEVISRLTRYIKNISFPPPAINRKYVNVKFYINCKVSKLDQSIILELK